MDFKKMLFAIFLAFPVIVCAQVTIGSAKSPVTGALLQLKENENLISNSSKGIILPRVFLTNLKPLTNSDFAASMGSTGDFSMAEHIGLLIYNLNTCLRPISYAGLYSWDGSEWIYLGNKIQIEIEYAPSLVTDWGDKVWKHKDQNGNDFYSSVFGSAGRWMTTSVAATSYDIERTASDTQILYALDGPSAYSYPNQGLYKTPLWCYPDGGGSRTANAGKDPAAFSTDPTMGLFYNWAAASNSRGGTDGDANNTDEGGMAAQPVIQGICPAGWHLPSDYEWTLLENAIIYSTGSFSKTPDIAPANAQYFNPVNNPSGQYRGTHGLAMTDPCAAFAKDSSGDTYKGTSFSYRKGGFDVLYTGNADSYIIIPSGSSAFFWTSSTSTPLTGISTAWRRGFSSSNVGVNRNAPTRQYMATVRCKKD